MSDFENRLIDYASSYHPKKRLDPYECEYSDGKLYFRFNSGNQKYCKEYVQQLLDLNFKNELKSGNYKLSIDGEDDWTEVVVLFDTSLFESSDYMGNIIASGEVTVDHPFKTEYLDSDDFMVIKDIKPGTYEYRVLNVRGWKPRQLKVDGEWYDVGDSCEELELILNSVDETTTVANIAPTVDYMGHVNPPLLLPNMDVDGVYPDEKEYYKKAKVVKTSVKKPKKNEYNSDAPWAAPIGRIVSGEPVRLVIGEQLGFIVKEAKDEKLLNNYPKFKDINTLDDIIKYPGELYLKTAYPHKDSFGMRLEDPKLTEYYGEVSRKNFPPYISVTASFDMSKDGWEDELEKVNDEFYTFIGFDGFRDQLKSLNTNPFVKSIDIDLHLR